MSRLADLKTTGRFILGLPGFLRRRLSLEEARVIVARRLAGREGSFLRLAERGIYGHPGSPYRRLLELAGCELGDLRALVRSRGLEGALRTLRQAGVYLTYEEFKGEEPLVRDGRAIPCRPRSFDNPLLGRGYEAASGGTTGAGTRVMIDLDHLAAGAPNRLLADAAHGLLGLPEAIWFGILPDSGLNSILPRVLYGEVPRRWFTPVTAADLRPALRFRLATGTVRLAARAAGVPLPRPEPVRLGEAGVIARWMAGTLAAEGGCLLRTHVSKAVRVSLAAREEGLSLAGAVIAGGGEPPTPAKVRAITASGARWVPSYFFTEAGPAGLACARPTDGNDQHLMSDHLALIRQRREVPGAGLAVDAFCFTTLLPTAPKILLNVESDDYGLVEERSCGCPLEECGFRVHLREIRSFRKLTGEGMTLVGSEMVRILEEVLPARFGGGPLDYQLREEEDDGGLTRLVLLVSPRVETPPEGEVVGAVLEALVRGSPAADLARAVWSQAGSLRVRRAEPRWTARGKLMPLHLGRRSRPSPPEDAEGGGE